MIKSQQQHAAKLPLLKRALHMARRETFSAFMMLRAQPLLAPHQGAFNDRAYLLHARVVGNHRVRARGCSRRQRVGRRNDHDQCVSQNLCGTDVLQQFRCEVARVIQQHNACGLRGARHLQGLIFGCAQTMHAVDFKRVNKRVARGASV